MSAEEWRSIPGFPRYEVSSLGRVLSHHRATPLVRSQQLSPIGYFTVRLSDGERKRTRPVHVLVAEAFHGPRPAGQLVRHLNGDPQDNRAENLCWGTASENQLDSVAHGTHPHAKKTHCSQGHAYDEANTRIYRGMRYCRACHRVRSSDYNAHRRNAA